jgi:hypothetical protein
MNAGRFGNARTTKFRCKAAHNKRTHGGGYVSESVLDAAVHDWLVERDKRIRAATERGVDALPKLRTPDRLPALQNKQAKLAERQDRLAEQRLELGIPQATYERLRDRYQAEAAALESEIRSLRVRAAAPLRVPRELLDRWGDIEVPEKREMLRAVISRIVVTPQRPISRVEVFPHEHG